MSENKEFLDSLKSNAKEKVAVLTEAQNEAKAAYIKLDEAHKSGDAALVEAAYNEFEGKSAVIKSIQKSLQEIQDHISLFQEVAFDDVPDSSVKSKV